MSMQELLAAHEYKYGRPQGGRSALSAIAEGLQRQRAAEEQQNLLNIKMAAEKELLTLKQNEERKNAELKRKFDIELELAKAGIDPEGNRQMSGEMQRVVDDKDGAFLKRGVLDVESPESAMSLTSGDQGDIYGNVIPRREKREIPRSNLSMIAEAARLKKEELKPTERKAQMEIDEAAETKKFKSSESISRANDVIASIDHLLENKNYFGPVEGAIAPVFPGKIEFDKNYKYVQANNIMTVLNDMKQQSKTGATGFGQLNEKELAVIENSAQKLDLRMDEETATKYLNEMKAAFQKIVERETWGKAVTQSQSPVPGEKILSIKRIR